MIISNATPLINFSMIGELGMLKQLFNTIVVPEAVWYEIVIKGKGYPTARAIRQSDFLSRQHISNTTLFHTLSMNLSAGETEAIVLAIERKAQLVLLDELEARAVAKHFGLNIMGSIGCLIEAKQRGIITQIRSYLDRMKNSAKFWVDDRLYERIMKDQGEHTDLQSF